VPPTTVAPPTTAPRVPGPGGAVIAVPGPLPAPPPTTVPPPPPTVVRRVTALGDSVMLGAAPGLKERMAGSVFVDAAVSRQVDECLDVLRTWRDKGLLGDVVVVHFGNNGTFRPDHFDRLRELLAGVPRVVVVNVKVPRPWEAHNNEVITQGVATMPNAVLVDWHAAAEPHPELFYSDGMHLKPEGVNRYADLVASAAP
jgi:hypothetical protein